MASDTALAQSARCTDTPRPRVTKPMISSPGTGVQHRDSRTMTSSRPSTCTPAAPVRVAGPLAARLAHRDGQLLLTGGIDVLQVLAHSLDHRLGRHVVLADRGAERVEVDVVHRLGHLVEHLGLLDLLHRQPVAAQRLEQLVVARVDGVLAPLTRVPLTDLVGRPVRLDELEPVLRRRGSVDLRGEDLDGVARGEDGVERHQPSVDPRADAGVTDLGVDRIGEVDRRGPDRQRDHPSLGREDEHLVLFEVDLQVGHELARDRWSPAASRRCGSARPGRPTRCGRPCSSSGRRRRTRPGCASRPCGSAPRAACPGAPPPSCATTGRG